MTERITKREFGTILSEVVLLPDDSFERHAELIITALSARGYGIVSLAPGLWTLGIRRPLRTTMTEPDKREGPPSLDFAFARIAQHIRDGDGDKAYQAFHEIILLERFKDTPED